MPSYIVMPPFVLLLGKSLTFFHYMRYSLISCTANPAKGWTASFVNIAHDIVHSYSWALYVKALVHLFKSSFLIHLHVLFLTLSSIPLANCPDTLFSVHSFFLCSGLVFMNSLGSVLVLTFLTATSNGSTLLLTYQPGPFSSLFTCFFIH